MWSVRYLVDRAAGGPRAQPPDRPARSWASRRLLDATRDWEIAPAAVVGIVLVPFIVVAIGIATALIGSETYKSFVREDGVAENIQFLAFVLAAVLSFRIAAWLRIAGKRQMALLYVVIAMGLVFVSGEEISWGQRIFGWETPEALEDLNRQDEINLHNVPVIEVPLRLAKLTVGLWGFVLPFALLRYGDRAAQWRHELSMLVPHYTLAFYFAGEFLWRLYRTIGPQPPPRYRYAAMEWSEVMELNLALGILLFIVYAWRTSRRGTKSAEAALQIRA